jgi:GrpB-like predicted nucleotidyltransferase (UPF0157 family)
MPPTTEDRLKYVTIGEPPVLDGPIVLVDSNPAWPEHFARQAERIHAALGERALRIEHVGSTLFKDAEIDLNLHVFSAGSAEIERLLLLRERLRENPAERQLYELTKRELASRTWKYVQDYADAKSEVIEGIISRARAQLIYGRLEQPSTACDYDSPTTHRL